MPNKKDALIMLLLAAIALAFYCYQLNFPTEKYFDEVYHAENAQQLIRGEKYYDVHPPLGKEIIAVSILHFGNEPWVWRLPSVLFGVGVLLLLYIIPVVLLQKRVVGIIAYFLCLSDGLCFTTARIALLNSNCAFFMLLGIFFLLQYRPLQRWPRRKAFVASGISFGLLMSTKWFGFLLVPLLGLWLIYDFRKANDKLRYILDFLFAFFAIPVIIYLVAYMPYARMYTHGLLKQLKFVWEQQISTWSYEKTLNATHPYSSKWWQWPFLLRPIWYHFQGLDNNMVRGIAAIGNPAVFIFIFPGMFYSLYKLLFSRGNKGHLTAYCFIALAGFSFCYFSWAVQPRALIFFNYFYFALIFAFFAEALLFYDIYKSNRIGKVSVLIILVVIAALFIYFLPLFNGSPISDPAFRHRMWLRNWI